MPDTPLLERLDTRRLITPADLPPSRDDFKVVGTFNPGAVQLDDGSVVLLVRVAETPAEERDGMVASPRYTPEGELVVDWIDLSRVDHRDPRWVRFNDTGFQRLRFISHLRVVRLPDGVSVGDIGPAITGSNDLETFGLEDPRIVNLDGEFCITAVGVSWHGVNTVLLTTTDFETFDRRGVLFMRENKDVVLFPQRINGEVLAISRPTGNFQTMQPEMWLSSSPDLVHFGRHTPFWSTTPPEERLDSADQAATSWDDGRVGGGVPPIRTDRGWLVVYHASCRPGPGEPVGVYAAGALLLDPENPQRVIAKTPGPFMAPEADFEKTGYVNAVVFPTGHARQGDDLLLYYGAADADTGVVRYRLADLMDTLVEV